MTQYELPDGFFGMETAPRGHYVNVVYSGGRYGTECYPFESTAAGWAPIVPLKKKVRFVVETSKFFPGRWIVTRVNPKQCVSDEIPTESAAQRIADIYNEVMP